MDTDPNKLYQWAIDNGFDPSRVPADAASNWVMRALHPASHNLGAVNGVPDMDSQPTVMFNWRQVDQIPPPNGLAVGDTWDMEMILFPGPCLLAIGRKKKSTIAWTNPTDPEAFLIFNNQYDYTTGQHYKWDANDVVTQAGIPTTWPRDIKAYRVAYAGFTGVCNAASLSDQGMLVAAQMRNPYTSLELGKVIMSADANEAIVQGLAWVTRALVTGQDGPTFDNAISLDPTAVQMRAKEGFYLPLRFGSGTFRWQDGSTVVNSWDWPWIMNADNVTPVNWSPYSNSVPVGPLEGDSNVGVICIRGLASTTSMSLTTRIGYEAMVQPKSVLRSFITPSCPPSFAAVEQYFKLSSALGSVYPASYNEKDILGSIIKGICGIGSVLSMVPGPIGKVAKIATPIVKTIGGALTGGKSKKGKAVLAQGSSGRAAIDDADIIEEVLDDQGISAEDVATARRVKRTKPVARRPAMRKTASRRTRVVGTSRARRA